jgi:aminobenzoyl-glutamate transport protein
MTEPQTRSPSFLGRVERFGNALPDPIFIFFWLILFLVIASQLAAMNGYSAVHPATGDTVTAVSLLSTENIRRLLVDMGKTLTGFAPLGLTLVVMLGSGVAERSGLFSAAMRAGLRQAPKALMTPLIVFIALNASLAPDAAYVVLIPLAGVFYASVGRHPIAGICAAFAGVSGGFAASLVPGQMDALILGLTESAVQASALHPGWTANIAGNWYFMAAMVFLFTPVGWLVTDRIVEPRLGPWRETAEAPVHAHEGALSEAEKKGLGRAGLVTLALIGVWAAMTLLPGGPLRDESTGAEDPLRPFYDSLVAFTFIWFLLAGAVFGQVVGTVKSHRDIAKMMTQAMADMAPYIALAFGAAHFVAMFGWSNLGAILAIDGARALEASGLPAPALLAALVLMTAALNLLIGSASAKWAAIAPIMVPMFMLLGVSPEMTTAAYRTGDSVTNIITPVMAYFPLVLAFARRWDPNFGLGGLMANMLPYSGLFLLASLAMAVGWAALGVPPGPGAEVSYILPTPVP